MPGKAFHSASPPALSPVWSRLARQPLRAFRDASFAIPLPMSQTLIPAVSAIPCALPVDSAPVHASGIASCHRSQPDGLGGPPARRPDDSAGRHKCTAETYRVPAAKTKATNHRLFKSTPYLYSFTRWFDMALIFGGLLKALATDDTCTLILCVTKGRQQSYTAAKL